MVLIWQHSFCLAAGDDHLDPLPAPRISTVRRSGCLVPIPAASAAATLTITRGTRSRCESRGDVDCITERCEVVDGCAKPGRSNECDAGVEAVPTGMDTNDVVLARAGRSARSMAAATASEEEATQPGERSRADLAAWREWHLSEDPPLPG